MHSFWVGTGWKMNHLMKDAVEYARLLVEALQPDGPGFNVFIVPPFTVLHAVCEHTKGSPVWVGAQNMSWEDRGAQTGEISPLMVKDSGARLVELGHSERRAQFGETDQTVNAKVRAALQHGLRPLVCVGETAEDKRLGVAREVLARQVKIALHAVPAHQLNQVLLAYEPVWAIGDQGVPASPAYASQTQGWIRQQVANLFGDAPASEVPVLYGGSVNQENALSFVGLPDIDGLFIGRAAWDPRSFIQIIAMIQQQRSSRS